ncbi:putative HIT finger domain protein [Aspergillus lucknowensis]|uniref:HIT-type domain-containing protein n=1 Tax=Aspergillus lucknowensis TaxID=176173 RepID=A0ABR4M1T5_9EURO
MYHVEVLPNTSTSHATPGWTYVPDKGFDPAKAAITPSLGRKRGIRDPARTDVSSRQANAIVRHLAELDRENHRDVAISIPPRQLKDAAGRGTRTKTTSNVRRILQSQKTFRNYLDDEEAALAQAASSATGATAAQRLSLNKITKPSSSRRSSTPATTPRPDPPTSRAKKDPPQPQKPSSADNIPATVQQDTPQQPESGLIKSQYDNDPLLKSYTPSAPSARIMRALLSEPPLTYNASRAGPPITGKSTRRFCCICGYWGKIRCRNCPQRTCGIECYKVHEDSRCGAFF